MNNARKLAGQAGLVTVTLLVTAAIAVGQNFEATPLFGTRQFGTLKLDSGGPSRTDAHMAGSITYGVAAGYRYAGNWDAPEDHDLVEFRWLRQDSHLYLKQNALQVSPPGVSGSISTFKPSVTLDHYLVDFSHEFAVPDARTIQPFLAIGFGASHLSTPEAGMTRFAMAVGGGMKVFPSTHYGFRVTVEYLPTVMMADIQRLVCAGGGCVVLLSGGIMNQLNITVGPAFRF